MAAHPDISRILLVRADGIGDLLNSTPAIRWVRQSYPQAHITCLSSTLAAPLLEQNPDVDRIWVAQSSRYGEAWAFARMARREGMQAAIAFQTSSWCHTVAALSGAQYRLGRDQKWFRRWWTHPNRTRYAKGNVHEIERNLDLVRPICEGEPASKPVLHITAEESVCAGQVLASHGLSTDSALALVHPGGSSEDKLWPVEQFAEIAQRLGASSRQVLVVHGPGEQGDAQHIASAAHIPLVGPSSLRELAAIIQRARLLLCNDSGPMHIAAALGVPTVALFGPTDHVRWFPSGGQLVRQEMDCWPCSAHKCRIGHVCIKGLPVESVWQAVEREWKGHNSDQGTEG